MDKRKIQEINIKLNNSIEDSSDLKNGATINYINNEWDFNGNFYHRDIQLLDKIILLIKEYNK